MKRVDLLRKNNIQPVVVFDGAQLPTKAGEEEARHR